MFPVDTLALVAFATVDFLEQLWLLVLVHIITDLVHLLHARPIVAVVQMLPVDLFTVVVFVMLAMLV